MLIDNIKDKELLENINDEKIELPIDKDISFNDKKSLEKKLTQTLAQLKTQEDSPDYFCIKKLWEEECTL